MLVEITQDAFDVEIDIVYATPNNFTGKKIYHRPACFLHPDAAQLLRQAIAVARPLGYRLKVLDAFRPSEAQWKLWEHTPNPDFIADPRRGSPHSMGVAVDVTLLETDGGAELDMGTPFDDLRQLSYHGNRDIPAEAQKNRIILMGIMTTAGFDFFRNEWWHYQLFKPRGRYPVLSDGDAGTHMM